MYACLGLIFLPWDQPYVDALVQAVLRCLAEQARVVRLPAHITDAVKRINAVRADLEAAGGGAEGEAGGPTNEEVAAALGMTASKVHFYRKVRARRARACARSSPALSCQGLAARTGVPWQ